MRIGKSFILLILTFFSVSRSLNPELFYNQKEFSKSKAIAYRNLSQEPNNIFSCQYNMKVGIFNYYAKNPRQAERYFSKSSKIVQDSLEKADAYYWLGRSLLVQDNLEKASYYFTKTLNYNPNPVPDFLFFYGIALYCIGKYSDALNCFQNFEAQTSKEYYPQELALFIAASAVAKGDYGLAEQILSQEELQESFLFYPIPAYLLGLSYYLAKDNSKGLNILRRISVDTLKTEIRTRTKLLIGEIYLKQGEVSKAVKEFDGIIDDTLQRFKDYAYLRAGISYYKLKQASKATERFDSLVAKYPNSQLNELAFYYKAKIYEQNRKWTKAKTEYRKFLASYPDSPLSEKAIFDLGRLIFLDENYIEAIALFEDFLKSYPKSKYRAEVMYDLIQSCYKLRRYDKARIYGDQYIHEFPLSEKLFDIRYILAQIGILKNDLDYARKHYDKITDGKYYPLALKGLGDIYYHLDSLNLSRNYYDLAERFSNDTLLDEIRYDREKVNLKLGRYKSKVEMLRNFLEKYPQSRKATMTQYEIGYDYLQQGDAAQAIVEFDKVYTYSPNTEIIPKVEMGKAESYTKLGQASQAIDSYLKIVNDFPSYILLSKVIKSLASLYYSAQKYDSAIIFYNRLISDFPKTQDGEDAFIELAKTYRILGRANESVKLLERFIIRYPESNRLKEAYFELVDLYKNMGKFSQAEKNIKEIFTKFGKTGDGHFQLGAIDGLQDKFSTAKAYYLNAYDFYIKEQKPELAALSLFEAGKCAMLIENWTEAKELFNRCINTTQDERLRIECENQIKLIPNE